MPARKRVQEARRQARRDQAMHERAQAGERRLEAALSDPLDDVWWIEHEQDQDPEYVPCSCYEPLSAMVAEDLAAFRGLTLV